MIGPNHFDFRMGFLELGKDLGEEFRLELFPDVDLVGKEKGFAHLLALEFAGDGPSEVLGRGGVGNDQLFKSETVFVAAFDRWHVSEILHGRSEKAGAMLSQDSAMKGRGVVPNGEDAEARAFEVGFGEPGKGHGPGGVGEDGPDLRAGFLQGVDGHEVSQPGRSGHEAIKWRAGAVVVIENTGSEIDQSRGDRPIEGNFSSKGHLLIPHAAHSVLVVLDVVSITDEKAQVNLVSEHRRRGGFWNLDPMIASGGEGGVLKEVGWNRADAKSRGGGDPGAFRRVPPEDDTLTDREVGEKLLHQFPFLGAAAVEPKGGGGRRGRKIADVMVMATLA